MSLRGLDSYPVEEFSKRIKWLIRYIPPRREYIGSHEAQTIRNASDLWRAVASTANLDAETSERTWKRCTSGESKIPGAIIDGLLKIYPIAREALIEPDYAKFEASVASITAARDRWTSATDYLANNREQLTLLSKQFYAGVDERKDLPMLAKRNWILKKPSVLEESSPLPSFDRLKLDIPAGAHQPLSEDYGDDRDRSIWRTVVREFCEELFNKEELSELKRHGEDFLELPEVKPYVDTFFRNGAAKIHLMGIGVEPLTLQAEILLTIVIDWEKASVRVPVKIRENFEGKAVLYDLSKEKLLMGTQVRRDGKVMHPAIKTGLILAAECYDFLLSSV